MLFEAILDYAEHGTEPDFDGVVGVAWDFIKPGIDRDSDRYGNQVLQKQYAAYVREVKKKGQTPGSFDDWKAIPDNERYRVISTDTGRYPTSTPTTAATTATTTATTIESTAGKPPASPKPAKKSFGDYGWVKLTDDEYNRLINDLGEDEAKRCITYIDESAQNTNNKNKWREWNLVVNKCHREKLGLRGSFQGKGQAQASTSGVDRLMDMMKRGVFDE